MTEFIGASSEYAKSELIKRGYRVTISPLTCGKEPVDADYEVVVSYRENNGEVLLYVGKIKRNI